MCFASSLELASIRAAKQDTLYMQEEKTMIPDIDPSDTGT